MKMNESKKKMRMINKIKSKDRGDADEYDKEGDDNDGDEEGEQDYD